MNAPRSNSMIRRLFVLQIVLLLGTLIVEFDFLRPWFKWNWPQAFAGGQIVGLAIIVRLSGIPRRLPELAVFLGCVLIACGLPPLLFLGEFKRALFQTLDVALRVVFPGIWLFAIGCAPFVPWLIRSRRLVPVKWWVACIATLAAAEPVAWLAEPLPDAPLRFPERLRPPPKGEIHIAAIGGSSTLGHPYTPKFGFAEVIAWRVRQLYPDCTVVLHNLARGGANLKDATSRLMTLQVRPQLLLVYSGHNEFFHDLEEFANLPASPLAGVDDWMHWSPLFRKLDRWIAHRRRMFEFRNAQKESVNVSPTTAAMSRRRLRRFQDQLQQLNAFCRREEIRQVWFIPAGAESGFEPNFSVPAPDTTLRDVEALRNVCEELRTSDCETASRYCLEGLKAQPRLAEFHFRLAECLERRGEFTDAAHHYRLALDTDGYPIRANRDYREAVRTVATANEIPLVETPNILRNHAPNGILGPTLFHDNVHMTLRGYYLTGMAASEMIVNRGLLEATMGQPASPVRPTFEQAVRDAGVSRDDLVLACRRIAGAFEELARWRYDPDRRNRDAARYADAARRLADGSLQPGDEGTEPLPGDHRRKPSQ